MMLLVMTTMAMLHSYVLIDVLCQAVVDYLPMEHVYHALTSLSTQHLVPNAAEHAGRQEKSTRNFCSPL